MQRHGPAKHLRFPTPLATSGTNCPSAGATHVPIYAPVEIKWVDHGNKTAIASVITVSGCVLTAKPNSSWQAVLVAPFVVNSTIQGQQRRNSYEAIGGSYEA
jgi:hypothetical protein